MKPRELTVVNTPVASCTGTLFAIRLSLSQCRATTSSNVLAASPSNVLASPSALLAPSWPADTGAWPARSLASLTSPALSIQPAAVPAIQPSARTASVFMPGR